MGLGVWDRELANGRRLALRKLEEGPLELGGVWRNALALEGLKDVWAGGSGLIFSIPTQSWPLELLTFHSSELFYRGRHPEVFSSSRFSTWTKSGLRRVSRF